MIKALRLPRLRLSTRLGLGVVALVLASTFVIATAALYMVKETVRASIANEQFARITSIANAIDQKFASRRILLQTFGDGAKAIDVAGPKELQSFLAQHTALTQAFYNIFAIDPSGVLIASLAHPEQVGRMNLKALAFFTETLAKQTGVISQPYRNQFNRAPQVAMTHPVFDREGRLLFIVVGTINLQETNFLGELAHVQFGKTGYLFILNSDGIMIDHPQKDRILKKSDAFGGTNSASQRALEGYDGASEATSRDGTAALYAYKRLAQTNWIAGARYPSAEAFEPLRQIERAAAVSALCLALLSGSIALAFMRRQLAPLEVLHEHMRAAQAAPAYVPMPTPFSKDEIGDLARTLDALLEGRQASADQLLAHGRQFLANMSHEIRSPMNAVIGLTYLLDQSGLDARQADMVAKLRVAGKSLLGIINDVLDLSKIEAGELTLECAPFALADVLRDLRELMSLQASEKGIRLTIASAADLPTTFSGDATRLGQILTNLVANAIKFTDRGDVQLTVRRAAEVIAPGTPVTLKPADASAPGAIELRFSVRDSGIGIAPDVQARLFTPFVQADSSTTRRFGGTGLGLSIVKRLVTLMSGRVGLDSEPGAGSTFWVELSLPVAVATPATAGGHPADGLPAAPVSCDLRGVRVLITDDSEINLEVASRILLHHGAHITLAGDGLQAVDLLTRQPRAFDVVLMDVQMPVMDGHEATRRIRSQLGLFDLPVIALTAGALRNELAGADAAGMSDFVRKPFEAESLVRTVWRHARPLAPSLVAEPRSAPDPGMGWPVIAGIDTADVRARLGGDRLLFASLLRRLLQEFAAVDHDLEAAELAPGDRAFGVMAERMHKLKGGASTLGAMAVSRLADQAEAACLGGRADDARAAVHELAARLGSLSEDAAPVLARLQSNADDEGRDVPTVPLGSEARRLSELVALLEEHSLGAVERFHELAPNLRQHLGDASFRRLQEQIDNLQFLDALKAIAPLAMTASVV